MTSRMMRDDDEMLRDEIFRANQAMYFCEIWRWYFTSGNFRLQVSNTEVAVSWRCSSAISRRIIEAASDPALRTIPKVGGSGCQSHLNNDACGGDVLLFIYLFHTLWLPRDINNGQMLIFFSIFQCILSFDSHCCMMPVSVRPSVTRQLNCQLLSQFIWFII